MFVFYFFFFKQKTAYEMRISDWSSDVCSSDLKRLALFPDGEEIRSLDMHPVAGWRHLQFDSDCPQMLDRTCGTDASIADHGRRLAVPFRIGEIECILQCRGDRPVIFGDHEDIAIELRDLLLPALSNVILCRRPGIGSRLVEERQRPVAQIHQFGFDIRPLAGGVIDPSGRLVAEARVAGAADDDCDFWTGHEGPLVFSIDGVAGNRAAKWVSGR